MEQVDAITYSEELVDAISDQKKNPSSNPKGSYSDYQQKFSTKIIKELVRHKDHPSRNPSDWPARQGGCAGNPIDFGCVPDSATEGYRHGCGAQWWAHFLDSKGVKPHWQGRLHTTGRQHHRRNRHIDSPNPKFHRYLCLPNSDWDTIFFQSKAVHHRNRSKEGQATQRSHWWVSSCAWTLYVYLQQSNRSQNSPRINLQRIRMRKDGLRE